MKAKPFLKWVGGKRQLLNEIDKKISQIEYNKYFEPFVGAGAVLFFLSPRYARINDTNLELINVYRTIKDSSDKLVTKLKYHKNRHSKEYFYSIREKDRKSSFNRWGNISRAARTIYLNKTCFNGLYRVNRKGEFNTPFGKYRNPNILDKENIQMVSEFLNKNDIEMTNDDFSVAVRGAQAGDLVYFDPPYDTVSETSSFTEYTAGGFTKHDQGRLKCLVDDLTRRGVYVLLSNSATDYILNLYREYEPHTKIVSANRTINSNPKKRGKVQEVLIDNFDQIRR